MVYLIYGTIAHIIYKNLGFEGPWQPLGEEDGP